MTGQLFLRLSAGDRALRRRCAIAPTAPRRYLLAWTVVTHLGGTGPALLAAGIPWLVGGALHEASKLALGTLVFSHLVVQILKRTVARRRPAKAEECATQVGEPDCFSFPSGHAAAAMSIAIGYGVALPVLAFPLLLMAWLIGFSRVRLGVHYPSDVLVGQLIAALTASAVTMVL